MGYRSTNYGRGQALHGDRTTTGAICCSTLPNCTEHGRGVIRVGDKTTACPKCGKQGVVADGEPRVNWMGQTSAVDGSVVICGCPHGTNRVIAPSGEWLGSGPSPEQIAQEKHQAMLAARRKEQEAEAQRQAEERDRNRVFAKSCLRGEGCNDAGTGSEPHTNFAEMAFYQAIPNNALQHAQAAKRKALPKPKQRSALYLWWNGHHEEMDYQAAVAAEERAWTARNAIADASELALVGGRTITSGTWAVRGAALGEIATGGLGAPVAGLLIGMYPGKLNDGEQDFIDRMRAEQMREAPTRVRFTLENDASGNPTPRGWHTPPGKDSVRVRRMEWDSRRQAYTFTTEEDPCITLIWTPDRTGESKPWDTGNHNPVRIPNPVVVDPLPVDTGIGATTSPTPEEKTFADYILILPVGGVPPIYVYIRHNPGQVTGKGQKISGIWLSDANAGNGSPIPSQIADRLRGQTFTDFDQFRKAFWLEVSRDPGLLEQFISNNRASMRKGNAPYTRTPDSVGKRERYEIHHIQPISQGGKVYDVDNMGITTPKHHIKIHKGE
ncbi:S-type pyocin domain-containing protein [Enterobacter cloacae]|uniref:S-type pyocin domain-containing protein n=1 Tax=Enterobacter cloacae TaxID=550 RepID=UPI0010E7EDB6|nr:S-type pyocin domain-containing protein [Enterobacter cloacae]MCF2227545.1 S-type pyocin domain-containing protein [Enterobacter cloacae]MCK6802974.1 S-type pyocin domain-containing protein [Enterobacter cloacae]MCL8175156.1 S-type pyocin domain-containing protein [Enterobacter cloacae]MCM7311079.1 S-type pyocin domain-containing protein [Enterobacter cloacae]MCM7413324.1 S-type pyocin domain-containing protein [Enterobacter cloacae]